MKSTVHFGFVAIVVVMIVLAFVLLLQVKKSSSDVLELVGLSSVKIEHAQTMNDTIRKRQILLLSMYVTDDAFELDEKIQEFYRMAADYGSSRQALKKLPMDSEEKRIHDLLDEKISRSLPENNRAVEMFNDNKSKEEIIYVIHIANRYQAELLETLDRFVVLQKKRDRRALEESRKIFENSFYWVLFLGVIAVVFAVFISRYVDKAVAEKNEQLRMVGEDMEKAYRKSEDATQVKSDFLATMSHEIRTPLTAIIGFAETTLFSKQSEEEKNNAIQTIIRSGRHLLQIINDILDLSKVEANKIEIERVEVNTFDVFSDIEHLVKPIVDDKGIGFSINTVFPLPSKIKVDELRVKQILINLCNNAIKFTEKGYVLINARCDCENDNFSFEVVDSGIGIAKENLELIFQPYRQADSSTTRKFGGTGLGLTLSKLLAESMGGTLTISSQLGVGSKFNFTLPFEKLDDTEIIYSKDNLPKKEIKSDNLKLQRKISGHILVAEDNEDNQALLSIYLKRLGVAVTIVSNGELAVQAVEKNDFDLILMDMRMPVMGGVEATEVLRKSGFKIPIIALTANAMKKDRDMCFAAGCDGFLTKPIDSNLLENTLAEFLSN